MNDLPKRKNMRLKEYDYSQNGYYFITICTHNRSNILGEIVGCGFHAAPKLALSNIGIVVKETVENLSNYYENSEIDKYVIMPNHIHFIIILKTPQTDGRGNPSLQNKNKSLPQIIGSLKSYTTKIYNELTNLNNIILWQKSYHDHIIRNEQDYKNICEYIENNPQKWELDKYYAK